MGDRVEPRWNGKTRQEIEVELLGAVAQRRHEYETLRDQYTEAMKLVQDVGLGNADGIDRLGKLRPLHAAIRQAIDNYQEALGKLSSLTVYRKMPE